MSPTTLPTVRTGQLDGRHVLIAVLAFFGIVFAVNGVLLWQAIATHSGLVANEPYRKGLAYNDRIAADERQTALGWTSWLDHRPDGTLVVAIEDAKGEPVSGLRIDGTLGRPSTARRDRRLSLSEILPGRYRAQVGTLEPGNWQVDIEAYAVSAGAAPAHVYRLRRRLWLSP